ncbi:outer membrane protein assembly factor BamB family protein [Frondihabitans cladoniiphilus]|uniref:Pyrrolo-quinoline quinone repeat domain-containing protein n=1 Tax=Frondihabitans cladoniiphilus TaxID=715785 RepID=A0ABP8VJL4_9MICO
MTTRSGPRARLLRAHPALRVALAYLAGGLVAALVVLVGVGFQPSYGRSSAWGGIAYDDLRRAPVARGWTTDLAAVLAPGVPPSCVDLQAFPATPGRVLVSSQSLAVSGGFTLSSCTAVPNSLYAHRVALFDPTTGRVLWTRDLGLSGAPGSIVEDVLPTSDPSRLVVQMVDDDSGRFVTLDAETGRTRSTATVPGVALGSNYQNERLVVVNPNLDEGATESKLWSFDDLETPVWTGTLSQSSPPQFLGDTMVATVDGRSVAVDGRTGVETPFASGRVDVRTSMSEGGVLYGRERSSGIPSTTVKAWDARGRTLWTAPLPVDGVAGVSRTCVLVTTPASPDLVCLDHRTGRERWRQDLGTQPFAGMLPGATSDDVVSARLSTGDPAGAVTRVFDGDTGRQRFVVTGEGAQLAAAGRTVGYSLDTAANAQFGSRSRRMAAVDLASGRILWTLHGPQGAVLDFWAGHLVSVRNGEVTGMHDAGNAHPAPVLE